MAAIQIADERAFSFLKVNERKPKPSTEGITEIRGPYYTRMGTRYLEDVLDTMGNDVDSLKFAGGSFTLMPRRAVGEIIHLCHQHGVLVSTGGFLEQVRMQGDGVTSLDWEGYPILRFSEVPEIYTEIIHAPDLPTLGMGECTFGPTAAAIGNAVAHALGARIRDMPFTHERIAAALLK